MSSRKKQKESRQKRREKKRRRKLQKTTCICYGGAFSDALPDYEWKKVMKSRANCPVHQFM